MNPHHASFQSGQTRFSGHRLLREIAQDAHGMHTWLAERSGRQELLHVLPFQRPLSAAEQSCINARKHLGTLGGRARICMTLAGHITEAGNGAPTALIEHFPALPIAGEQWIPLQEWISAHGPITARDLAPLLPQMLRHLKEEHGFLSPEQVWLAVGAGQVHGLALSAACLADFFPRSGDVASLGSVLFFWLTGQRQMPAGHSRIIKALAEARKNAPVSDRVPDHWRRIIATSQEDESIRPGSVLAFICEFEQPAKTALPPPRSPVFEGWKQAAAFILLILVALFFMQARQMQLAKEDTQAAPTQNVSRTKEPHFLPLPEPKAEPAPPAPEVPEQPMTPPPSRVIVAAENSESAKVENDQPKPPPQAVIVPFRSGLRPAEPEQPSPPAKKPVIAEKAAINPPKKTAQTESPSHKPKREIAAEVQTPDLSPRAPVQMPQVSSSEPAPPRAVPISRAVSIDETPPAKITPPQKPAAGPRIVQAVPVNDEPEATPTPDKPSSEPKITQAVPFPEPRMPELTHKYNLDTPPGAPPGYTPAPMPPEYIKPLLIDRIAPPIFPGEWNFRLFIRRHLLPHTMPQQAPKYQVPSRAHIPGQPDQPLWQRP